jgi:hypothetical protein
MSSYKLIFGIEAVNETTDGYTVVTGEERIGM